jgi:hypothetical protein
LSGACLGRMIIFGIKTNENLPVKRSLRGG